MACAGPLSPDEIADLVGRASNLTERLTDKVIPTGQDQPEGGQRLERWKRLAANHGKDGFGQMLGAFGLRDASDAELLGRLGEVRLPPGSPLPPWADFLQEMTPRVAAAFAPGSISRPHELSSAARSIPFAPLYSPIVALAWQKVTARVPQLPARLSKEAGQGLGCELLRRLSEICSLALQPRFLAFKAVRQSGLASSLFGERLPARRATGHAPFYRAFVDEQGAQGLGGFLREYPVAARLAAEVTLWWVEFVVEFLQRLEADEPAIASRFFAGQGPGRIVSVRAGLSDPHHHGRSVLIVHFTGGRRLVYKPRPMQADARFFDLLRWVNRRSGQPPLRALDVLAREGYGWETFVAPSPCPNRQAARQWYRRAGALLYFLHAARGIDLHCENMLATADGPVPVDLEALGHPVFPGDVLAASADGEEWPFDASVLRTGMLPVWEQPFGGQRPISRSALDAPTHQWSAAAGLRWKKVNSDRMEVDFGRSRRVGDAHRPRLGGKLLSARGHAEELVAGFKWAARFVAADRKSVGEGQARIVEIGRLKTRLIKRPTMVYRALIRSSLNPRCLVSGLDRSLALQILPFTKGDESSRQIEVACLERLDVPYFHKTPEDTGTTAGESVIAPENLARQVCAIRASVKGRLTLARGGFATSTLSANDGSRAVNASTSDDCCRPTTPANSGDFPPAVRAPGAAAGEKNKKLPSD